MSINATVATAVGAEAAEGQCKQFLMRWVDNMDLWGTQRILKTKEPKFSSSCNPLRRGKPQGGPTLDHWWLNQPGTKPRMKQGQSSLSLAGYAWKCALWQLSLIVYIWVFYCQFNKLTHGVSREAGQIVSLVSVKKFLTWCVFKQEVGLWNGWSTH